MGTSNSNLLCETRSRCFVSMYFWHCAWLHGKNIGKRTIYVHPELRFPLMSTIHTPITKEGSTSTNRTLYNPIRPKYKFYWELILEVRKLITIFILFCFLSLHKIYDCLLIWSNELSHSEQLKLINGHERSKEAVDWH